MADTHSHQANHSTSTPRSASPSNRPAHSYLDTPITLETYRTLLGIPAPRTSTDPGASSHISHDDHHEDIDIVPERLPRWWPASLTPSHYATQYTPLLQNDPEALVGPRGIYPTLLREQRTVQHTLHAHTTLKTSIILTQLLLSILLILLASLSPSRHPTTAIFIGIFAALNGVCAGVLALGSARDAPRARLGNYIELLRALRAKMEWTEREVEGGLRVVTYREVVGLRDEFETLRAGNSGVVFDATGE